MIAVFDVNWVGVDVNPYMRACARRIHKLFRGLNNLQRMRCICTSGTSCTN
jgi:hypothetical protein